MDIGLQALYKEAYALQRGWDVHDCQLGNYMLTCRKTPGKMKVEKKT